MSDQGPEEPREGYGLARDTGPSDEKDAANEAELPGIAEPAEDDGEDGEDGEDSER